VCLAPLKLERHYFASNSQDVAPRLANRLAKEFAGLSSSLPMTSGGAVFVRMDESHAQLWRVLITGPQDTPYENGCFLFDVTFTPDYPLDPPKVQFLTTGGGRERLNPNLYACGKVCLSLTLTLALTLALTLYNPNPNLNPNPIQP